MPTAKVTITTPDTGLVEILIAQLSELGYNAFEENEHQLLAFIKAEEFNELQLKELLTPHLLDYTVDTIADENWNALWESNFDPVVVDDFCAVRADFHMPFAHVEHEIVITPKMSFGTGHHATTYMMLQQMAGINFKEKHVADFGTGTGVLAILAEKLGSKGVLATDYDDWSIENAAENFERNNCSYIELVKADGFNFTRRFDVILANINKNVILNNAEAMMRSIVTGGTILLSGLLLQDVPEVINAFEDAGKLINQKTKDNWACLQFKFDSSPNKVR